MGWLFVKSIGEQVVIRFLNNPGSPDEGNASHPTRGDPDSLAAVVNPAAQFPQIAMKCRLEGTVP